MKVKPIVSRELAIHDINEILAYYLGGSVMQAAYGFIDALEEAYGHIGRHPGTGSQLYAHEELNLPSLRLWPLTRYPHLVFTLSVQITFMFGAGCTASRISRRGCPRTSISN